METNQDFNDLGMKNKIDDSRTKESKSTKKVLVLAVSLIVVFFATWLIKSGAEKKQGKQIEVDNNKIGKVEGTDLNGNKANAASRSYSSTSKKDYPLANVGNVSPVSGLACDNWDRRPIAVMQPTDETARPLAGFSEADMVIEMPVLTNGKPRMMGVYICGNPEEVGSMRSSRHDFIHLAKGLDAIYVHWGGSIFAKEKLNANVIENMNCNNDGGQSAASCCFRKEGISNKTEDSGYAKFDQLLTCANDFGYRMKSEFSGYAHQGEAPLSDRPENGILKVGLDSSKGSYYVEYEYDVASNSYLRIWGGTEDTDRNNGKRLAPKNVVVLTASQEAMEEDPHYNNVQLGDPWYDTADGGEAFYYLNGQERRGTWKKDKNRIDSKLVFLNEDGQDMKFVPGQIWVEVLEPGRTLKWKVVE